jgi:hypothetical protein
MQEIVTMQNEAPLPPSLLTAEEANFVYNLEVLGLPVRKAADLAGVRADVANRGHIVEAREALKRELRGNTAITKEDVISGFKEGVDLARILADPKTMVAGWKEIGEMLGYYAPQKMDINLNTSIEVLQKTIRAIPTDELVKRLGAEDVIDADFREAQA